MKRNLTKKDRLRKKTDIKRVFSSSKYVKCPGVKLLYINNKLKLNRILITSVKHYGNAVQRNRARRTGKEIYRNIKNSIKTGYDLIIMIYPGKINYREHEKDIISLFIKAGLYNGTL